MSTPSSWSRGLALVAAFAFLTGCLSLNPTPTPIPSQSASPSPTLAATPSPTPAPQTFPLAVVTGITNLKAVITLDELTTIAASGKLVVSCGVTVTAPTLTATAPCLSAATIPAAIAADQNLVALLPAVLVEPATKVLPIAGDGPFGLFGPDLFGDPASRALPYPVLGFRSGEQLGDLDPTWTAQDASQTWTLTMVGSLCADRGAAHQAVTLGKGWNWVFDGGTAKYAGLPFYNPNPPPGISSFPIVQPVETGNDRATSNISNRSDVALADQKCPIIPTQDWAPNDNTMALNFANPEDVLPRWKQFLGIDAVFLPADHQSDKGVFGIQSTLQLLDKYRIPHTGLGLNLDQALQPAYVQVAGLKVAFVSWDEVPGPVLAGPTTPGVAWMTQPNINAAVHNARAGGADLVICDPQWWGGDEYHLDLWPGQITDLGWLDQAGCDQVIGAGTHVAGPVLLRQHPGGVSLVLASPGNYMFGQDWWQITQEGVILQATFRGKTLVNVRLHPIVMVDNARPTLTDPQGDGHYVLDQIWKNSNVKY